MPEAADDAGAALRRTWEDGWAEASEAEEAPLRTVEPEADEEERLTAEEPEDVPVAERSEPEEELRTVERFWVPVADELLPDTVELLLRDAEPVVVERFWVPVAAELLRDAVELLPDTVELLLRDAEPVVVERFWVTGVAELLRDAVELLLRDAVAPDALLERVTCLASVLCREAVVLRVCEAEERVCASTPDGVARSIARMATDSAEVTVVFIS